MSDVVCVKGLGSAASYVRDQGLDLVVVLLKAGEADAAIRLHETLADMLAAAGNTEADFTNYARKTIANASVTVVEDASGTPVDLQIADQTWTAAGGTTDNTLARLVICTDGASDAARVPVTVHDFVETTTGNDLNALQPAAGFYGAAA